MLQNTVITICDDGHRWLCLRCVYISCVCERLVGGCTGLLCLAAGVIYVVDELDFELKKQYELTIRATDSVSGVFAEVIASIRVEDVNDCPPEFSQDAYNISVGEAANFGTSILRVYSKDNDTGEQNNVDSNWN